MEIFSIVLSIILLPWMAYEIWLVYRDREHGKGSTQIDRGSRYLNFISLILGIPGAAALSGVSGFFFPGGRTIGLFWIGVAVMLSGFALRLWSVKTLGNAFRTTIETDTGQKVIRNGPYKLIRHPSYSGLLLLCLGFGVAVQNWLSLAMALLLPLSALLYRIHIEEAELSKLPGSEYAEYKRHTKKIIPWIW